jgi:hypothetical protein
VDISSALNVEKLTDINTLLHLPSYPNRVLGALAVPMSNSRLEIHYLDSTINHKDQQNLFYPADVKSNEKQLKTFISPSKLNKRENSCQKKNHIRNEFYNCVDQEHMNKDTRICGIYSLEENDRPPKNILNVSQIDGSMTDSFEDMLKTQNQAYELTHEISVCLPLQHTVVQKSPLQDCRTGRGTELSNEEERPVLSCDMFDASGNSILDEAACDKLQNSGNQAATIDAALNKAVTRGANYFMQFQDSSSIMEDDFYKGDELCEKYPSQNNCSRIQPFMAVTVTDEGQGGCASPQDVNCNEDIGSGNTEMAISEDENQKRSNKDTKTSANGLLHGAEFQSNSATTLEKIFHKSHKTIQLKKHASSKELTTKTSNHSHYKEVLLPVGEESSTATCVKQKKHKNKVVKGRYYMSMKGKLEVPGVFQKRGKTKRKLCSNQQTTSSAENLNGSETETSTMNIEDVTAGTFASSGRNKRKTTFQTPFKKIPSHTKQVPKLKHFLNLSTFDKLLYCINLVMGYSMILAVALSDRMISN